MFLMQSFIVGVVVGPVFGGLLMISLLYVVRRKRRLLEKRKKDYHVFISYRVATDSDLSEQLCNRLQTEFVDDSGMPIKCYFDRQDIRDGTLPRL